MNLLELQSRFEAVFGPLADAGDLQFYFAPGRVNLIGEHIDYNGGFVFPCAIGMGTYLAVKPREDRQIRAFSGNFETQGVLKATLEDLTFDSSRDWLNYPMGVLFTLVQEGYVVDKGFDAYFYGDLPNGAGLSSSASIELVTAVMANDVFQFGISHEKLAVLCQKSENQYNGVNCGIMDQFAIAMGKEDQAVMLNCDTLEYDYVPLVLKNHDLVIINSNKKRSLAESNYNERRESCEEALSLLQTQSSINELCELTMAEFEALKGVLTNERIMRRARHAVSENERVKDAVTALKEHRLEAFGQLMNASHESLKTDFEVTGRELDALASLAQGFDGVLGSRMTGAGFGGCTITLVEKAKTAAFVTYIEKAYEEAVGLKAACYVVAVGDGAKRL